MEVVKNTRTATSRKIKRGLLSEIPNELAIPPMKSVQEKFTAEGAQIFFLFTLFLSIPFSIAGSDFAIIGLYLSTIYLFVRRRQYWIPSPYVYGLGIFMLGAVLSTLLSADPLSGAEYFRKFWRLGLPFLVFFALAKRDPLPYLRVLLIVSGLLGIYAVVQHFTGLDILRSQHLRDQYRPSFGAWYAVGAFSHHLTFGGVTLLLFSLFAPAVFDKAISGKHRAWLLMAAMANLSGAILCLGRSIWLGIIASVGVMVLLKLRLKHLLVMVLLLLIPLATLTLTGPETKQKLLGDSAIGARLSSYTLTANVDRIMMWTAAVEIIADNPIFGLGPNSGEQMQPYYDRLTQEKGHLFQHRASVGVHNIYLQNWINFGLLGLVGYLLMWLLILYQAIRAIRLKPMTGRGTESLLIGISAGLVGILVAGFFENNFRDGEVQIAILTMMGLAMALTYQKVKTPFKEKG